MSILCCDKIFIAIRLTNIAIKKYYDFADFRAQAGGFPFFIEPPSNTFPSPHAQLCTHDLGYALASTSQPYGIKKKHLSEGGRINTCNEIFS
jgi:hypothetical protein